MHGSMCPFPLCLFVPLPDSLCPSFFSLSRRYTNIHGERSMQKTMMKRLGSIGACSAGWLACSSISIRLHDVCYSGGGKRLSVLRSTNY